jgi:Fe-S cluster assembly protein SufD
MPLDSRAIALPYAERFAAVAASLPGHDVPWLRELRREAAARFARLGLPSPRVEQWKYTNLNTLAVVPFEKHELADGGGDDRLVMLPSALSPHRLVFVNGRCRPDQSLLSGLPSAVTVTSLAEALRQDPDSLQPVLSEALAEENSLLALNAAFMTDGYVIRLAAGATPDQPLELLFVTTSQSAAAHHLRNLITLEAGSSATLIERYVGDAAAATYWSHPVCDIRLGQGATLRHYKLQDEGHKAFHLAATAVQAEHDARYESFVLTTGAGLARNEIKVVLDGTGASCRLDGGYLARGRQHVDTTTEIIHAQPHTTSEEVYKGVLDDQARGVFQGRIVVKPDAQKSDGHQLSKAILLSERAEIDTKPELEIYADDVKCSHGATAGELDEDALFYLRARGIDMAEARRLLIEAFIGDALENVTDPMVRTGLQHHISAWMANGSGEQGR